MRRHRAGDPAAAKPFYLRVLAAIPEQADALHLLGLAELQEGFHANALSLFKRAVASHPGVATFHLNLGHAARRSGAPAEAEAAYRVALRLDPAFAEAQMALGNLLKSTGRIAEAVPLLTEARRSQPANVDAILNLAAAHQAAGDLPAAAAEFQAAINLRPDVPEAHNALACVMEARGRIADAEARLRHALLLNPRFVAAHNNLGRLLKARGDVPGALENYRHALALDPGQPQIHSNLLLGWHCLDGVNPAELADEHRHWNRQHALPLRSEIDRRDPTSPRPRPGPGAEPERIRVGYVSPDFRHHAVAAFVEPVLRHHDRSRFEVFCYSDVQRPDEITRRFERLADAWRPIFDLDDRSATAAVRRDRIDVLVDLAGHTARNRLLLFARRAAPVQLTWIGYPNTTGLAEMDYRVTDPIADPPAMTEAFHSETLIRLDRCFSCYQPPDPCPPVGPPPFERHGHVTFGSLNNVAKITPRMLRLWARLLERVPDSHLRIRARGLNECQLQTDFLRPLRDIIADPGRVTLDVDDLPVHAHLERVRDIDIAVDTHPYNGTTTTCEALWMGVPVITLAGTFHAARVGASLLTHAGHSEWVAQTESDYLDRLEALSADRSQLRRTRLGLRGEMRSSPLLDHRGLVGELEQHIIDILSR